jgi:hypothetical protein
MSAECVTAKTGTTLDAARMRLKRMAIAGELERKKIRIMIQGAPRQIHIYRPQS